MTAGRLHRARPAVCHISTVHCADDSRVFWRECVGLAESGFPVTLVARAPGNAVSHRVRIVALPSYSSRVARMTIGVARAFYAGLRSRAPFVHLHDPELIPLLPLFRMAGRYTIYDAHEWLSRQVATKEYLTPRTRRLATLAAKAAEFLAGWSAHRIVTVNGACASIYPPGKVAIVANYPDVTRFAEPPESAPLSAAAATPVAAAGLRLEPASGAEQRLPAFVYVGGISRIRGIASMVSAIGQLNATDGARLTLVGPCDDASLCAQVARDPGWPYVDYRGAVPHDAVTRHMHRAVAGLATLLPTPNHLVSWPVKVFEYMAAGLPVILSDFPPWRQMLDGVDCALWADPDDPAAIAAAMRKLLHDEPLRTRLGAAGRQAVLERFNWDAQLRKLVAVYDDIRRRRAAVPRA